MVLNMSTTFAILSEVRNSCRMDDTRDPMEERIELLRSQIHSHSARLGILERRQDEVFEVMADMQTLSGKIRDEIRKLNNSVEDLKESLAEIAAELASS